MIEDVFAGEGIGVLTAASIMSPGVQGSAAAANALAGAGRAVDYAALPQVTEEITGLTASRGAGGGVGADVMMTIRVEGAPGSAGRTESASRSTSSVL